MVWKHMQGTSFPLDLSLSPDASLWGGHPAASACAGLTFFPPRVAVTLVTPHSVECTQWFLNNMMTTWAPG